MTSTPALKLFELVGSSNDVLLSPFCWTVRFALHHKQLPFEQLPWRRVEKDRIAASGRGTAPVLIDDRQITDSWQILKHLEEAYPSHPALFGSSGTAEAQVYFVRQWVQSIIDLILALIAVDLFTASHPSDQQHYRRSWEGRLGMTLEQYAKTGSISRVRAAFEPLRQVLTAYDYVGGQHPDASDYSIVGLLMWVRACSSKQLFEQGDPVYAWQERMLDLFNGMARGFPSHAA